MSPQQSCRMKDEGDKAIILLSGGLDSLTCLAIAKSEGFTPYALSADYGQKHRAELEAAKKIAKIYGAREHRIFTIDIAALGGSALTDVQLAIPEASPEGKIPVTYVPARNTIFLSYALAYAEVIGAKVIYYGANNLDYSGYPDCRPEYIHAFQTLANLATKAGIEGHPIEIRAPLLEMSKAQIIQQGISFGLDYGLTVTCYQADTEGRACGKCEACHFRQKGFKEAGVIDPTKYQYPLLEE